MRLLEDERQDFILNHTLLLDTLWGGALDCLYNKELYLRDWWEIMSCQYRNDTEIMIFLEKIMFTKVLICKDSEIRNYVIICVKEKLNTLTEIWKCHFPIALNHHSVLQTWNSHFLLVWHTQTFLYDLPSANQNHFNRFACSAMWNMTHVWYHNANNEKIHVSFSGFSSQDHFILDLSARV